MSNIVETVPFSYDELYTSIQQKFTENGYDTEPGSNTSQLITAMAYLTSMLNVNTAVNINEAVLPLATKRNNVLQDARALGYEIQHKQSYTYFLTIQLTAGNHTIPKYTKFTDGTHNYYYMGKQIELLDVAEGTEIQILVIEGTLHQFGDYPDSLSTTTTEVTNEFGATVPQYYIDIPFIDIEENGIEVYVTYYDDYGNLIKREEWSRSTQFMVDADTILKKQYVRLDNIEYKTPRIYFELAGVGDGIRVGSLVEMNVLVTSGTSGAVGDITNPSLITHEIDGGTITAIELVTEGTDEESIESIKQNAPKFYNSANRIVTKSDYEAICNRQSSINTSLVWGGDDEYPKSPGHIWFTFFPSVYERNFTSDQFNYEYTLDNDTYTAWDYTLDPVADEVAYDAQAQTADIFYSKRFLENSEIRSYEYTEDGELIQPGVWDVLDLYKIPTLEFHNRHPIYLDFEYDISILKYNITDSKASVHQTIFEIIDNFFTGENDTVKLEKFDGEYFHSSLEKRIDQLLTDVTGYTNTVSTKLMLTKKNVSQENYAPAHRDLYIPLSAPFETYFDVDGYLQYSKLPSIDTLNFVEYAGETGKNLYTDWTEIQAQIDATTPQNSTEIIIAPIRLSQTGSTVLTAGQSVVTFTDVLVIPDDPTQIDEAVPVLEFSNTEIILTSGGVPQTLVYNTDWTYDVANPTQITLTGLTILEGDSLTVNAESIAGNYHLFNTHKKFIIIQLYVNAVGYSENPITSIYSNINPPKSYLTTLEGFYDYTIDKFYLTTEGYSVISEDAATILTGAVVKTVSPALYNYSPIKMDYFRRNRYMNLDYTSANFPYRKNIIPRLKRVTFAQGV